MNLLRTLAAISSMTMLSRLTGLLRESLFARAFGASAYTDAFNIAFRIPNLLRRLFAEGAFSQAFVPILSEYKNKNGETETKILVDHVGTALLWATILTSLLGILGSPFLILMVMGDQAANKPGSFNAAVVMMRWMFPYIACMSFVALAGGVLNTWRQFKIPAFTPVLLNISFILASLLLAQRLAEPIYAMAIAVCVGGLLQVGLQIPSLVKIGMLPKIALNPMVALRDPGVQRILRKMGPAVFAVSAAQVSLFVNMSIAAHLGEGSVSTLNYADRLMEFPSALLGVALGTVLLPSLSKANTDGDHVEYSALLDWGLRLTFLLALPAAVGLATLAEPMVATLYNYGKFDASVVHRAALPLQAYAVGLLGIILVKTLAPAFYSRQDIRTPVNIAMLVLVLTQVMNFLFVYLLNTGVAGLALSIGMGACINALLLYLGLRQKAIYTPHPGWGVFFGKVVVAVTFMGLLCWQAESRLNWAAMQATPWLRAASLMGIIGVGATLYFAVLFALGFRLADFKRRAD